MKGSMLLSLITLCVVMVMMESRIDHFLHPDKEEKETSTTAFLTQFLSDFGSQVSSVGRTITRFFNDLQQTAHRAQDDEPVVITRERLRKVWVWRDNAGQLRSTTLSSEHPQQAESVLIPRDMTAQEFFESESQNTAGQPPTNSNNPDRGNTRRDAAQSSTNNRRDRSPQASTQRSQDVQRGIQVLREQSSSQASSKDY